VSKEVDGEVRRAQSLLPLAIVIRVASKGAKQRALPEDQEGIARAWSPGLLTRHTAP
jgi:hypothetical protein